MNPALIDVALGRIDGAQLTRCETAIWLLLKEGPKTWKDIISVLFEGCEVKSRKVMSVHIFNMRAKGIDVIYDATKKIYRLG